MIIKKLNGDVDNEKKRSETSRNYRTDIRNMKKQKEISRKIGVREPWRNTKKERDARTAKKLKEEAYRKKYPER